MIKNMIIPASRVMLAILLTGFVILVSFNEANSQKLNAFMSYAVFSSPESGPYIETYLTVEGTSVKYIPNNNGKLQAAIQVIMLFKKGENIVNYDKYELNSPEVEDTTNLRFSFIDQQRYSLANGEYEFEIQIWDKNRDAKPFNSVQPLIVDIPSDKVALSGIQLLASYTKSENPGILTKNGYDLIPYIFNYYPEKVNKITFYAEIYNTAKVLGEGEKYLVSYFIETAGKDKPLEKYVSQKRETATQLNVIFSEFDISELPSGNYNLVVKIKDKNNTLIGRNQVFIMRSNPKVQLRFDDIAQLDVANTFASRIDNIDTLRMFIRYLEPISVNQEVNFAQVHLATSDLITLQKFFYKFWTERNELEPEREWVNYFTDVNKVNFAYSTIVLKGYESDRGRTYLKYGPPNAISENYNEPGTYPYEIWHYYVLKDGQRNKKFVFYTKDIVTNDFTILHSDVNGEVSNYRWQQVIYSRVDAGFNIDKGVTDDTWGGNSQKYFDLPR